MKTTNKKEKLNLLFSAFLIIAFVACGYFFSELAKTMAQPWGSIVSILIYVVFGLIIFYATRIGDGKAVFRFSLSSLILVVLPTLYIILAYLIEGMPLHANFTGNAAVTTLAAFALGYALPYTFVSGFELAPETAGEAEEETAEKAVEESVEAAEETSEEAVEGSIDTAEETAEETVEETVEKTVEATENVADAQ